MAFSASKLCRTAVGEVGEVSGFLSRSIRARAPFLIGDDAAVAGRSLWIEMDDH
jgi:hypothetical protein